MTLDEIIGIADAVYPDGLVGLYHADPHGGHGDTLAKFIAAEIWEAHRVYSASSDAKQLETAIRRLETGYRELGAVIGSLRQRLRETAAAQA